MKLIYRGTTYDYDPTQAKADRYNQSTHQEPYNLTYRGVSYRVDPRISKPISDQSRSYELIYRGCTYQGSIQTRTYTHVKRKTREDSDTTDSSVSHNDRISTQAIDLQTYYSVNTHKYREVLEPIDGSIHRRLDTKIKYKTVGKDRSAWKRPLVCKGSKDR